MELVESRIGAGRHHVGVGRPDPDLVDGEGARRVEAYPRHEPEIQVRFHRAAGGLGITKPRIHVQGEEVLAGPEVGSHHQEGGASHDRRRARRHLEGTTSGLEDVLVVGPAARLAHEELAAEAAVQGQPKKPRKTPACSVPCGWTRKLR
jgi:hypothetical protein